MDLDKIDMKKEFEEYNKNVPVKIMKINGKDFKYRYYKNLNPQVNATIVMLAGGSGMADGFFTLAKDFMDKYSFITFNYPEEFKNNEETADAIASLIKELKAENVYFWGQSYGGMLAQMIAKRHPEVVKGLILTSTASFSNDIKFEGMQCMVNMINEKKEKERIEKYKKFPMFLLPIIMNLGFKKYVKDKPEAYANIKELMKQLKPIMTKDYFCHMTRLLGDLRNYMGKYQKEDFEYLRGRVLIIEPNDDTAFTDDIKEALIQMMPSPKVIREIKGGHLALIFNTDDYMKNIYDFMDEQGL